MEAEHELLHQRVAVVTGGAGGIGLEICRLLATAGIRVVLTARRQEQAERAVAQIEATSDHLLVPAALEVTDSASLRSFMDWLDRTLGRVDVLINNAGIAPQGHRFMEMTDAELDLAMQTHFYAPLRLIRAVLPHMQAQGYGRIVNVSSSLGQLAQMGARWPAYRLSKAALNALTAVVAADVAGSNILVNAVCPGWCRTPLGGPDAPRAAEEGAADIVWLATLPDDGPSGGFFRDRLQQAW
jgi:NAD(P)-dependent dehydrogenase (short-subunit alcohol dehydrogenase family)